MSYDDYILQCLTKDEKISTLKFNNFVNIPQILIDEIGNNHNKVEILEIISCFNEDIYNFDSIRHLLSLKSLKIVNLCEKAQLRDEYFPTGICKATRLETIQFNGFIFESFPKRISALINVKEMDLSNNTINILPNRIGDLTGLTSLHLAGNKIPSIPSRIGDLIKLESLDLSNNEVEVVPKRILKILNIYI